jgi:hypothetical protein
MTGESGMQLSVNEEKKDQEDTDYRLLLKK